jgi:proteasome accessory factor B
VWQHAGLAEATSGALVKLRAGGVDVDASALSVVEPHLATPEPSFGPLWDAVLERTPVRFAYRRPGREAAVRTLEPYGIVSWHGHWYVVGHDRDREAVRMFRLSRVEGPVTPAGRPGSYVVPEGTDVRALAASLEPDESSGGVATLRVRVGSGFALRRQARAVESLDASWDRVEVPFGAVEAMAEQVTTHGADVVVESPEELRTSVIERLRGLAGAGAR